MARHQQPTPAQRQEQNQPKRRNKDVSFEEWYATTWVVAERWSLSTPIDIAPVKPKLRLPRPYSTPDP